MAARLAVDRYVPLFLRLIAKCRCARNSLTLVEQSVKLTLFVQPALTQKVLIMWRQRQKEHGTEVPCSSGESN